MRIEIIQNNLLALLSDTMQGVLAQLYIPS